MDKISSLIKRETAARDALAAVLEESRQYMAEVYKKEYGIEEGTVVLYTGGAIEKGAVRAKISEILLDRPSHFKEGTKPNKPWVKAYLFTVQGRYSKVAQRLYSHWDVIEE